MSARRARSGARILSIAADLYPGYFALVMATGALSIALHLHGYEMPARALLALNVLAYVVLGALLLLRLLCFPRRIAADMTEHARAPGFFTVVAGTCVLGTDLALAGGLIGPAMVLWEVGIALGVLVMYSFFFAVVTRPEKPDLESGINGAWLIAAVAAQSVAILGAVLAPQTAHPQNALFFSLVMYMIGAMLYLSIITLIFYRLTFVHLTGATFGPPYWINMGAVAITTLAGATLISRAPYSPLLRVLLPFLDGFTIFFWAAASWWIPLLFILMIWRHGLMRYPVRYEPQYWSLAFPLAMYTTATLRLADELHIPPLAEISRGFLWLAALVWLVVFAGMIRSFLGGERQTSVSSV
ncbi:MAG TPA: tellurite resistance/C4-dicarboxylate transporter family protein [Steroidobacteraceae bacterium]|jgi:tellurite resistance protein TehA-like permease|nr:tellurite resistance/C4-dicarboxylate transporter family protein [Steroidobacteraceae bacterium]